MTVCTQSLCQCWQSAFLCNFLEIAQAVVGSKSPEVLALSRTLSIAQVAGLLSICCPTIAVVAQGTIQLIIQM
jgi:hypothetical protein